MSDVVEFLDVMTSDARRSERWRGGLDLASKISSPDSGSKGLPMRAVSGSGDK